MYSIHSTLSYYYSDRTIRVWKTHIECSYHLKGHLDNVMGISIDPDNETIYSASLDATVRAWNIKVFFLLLLST